jgi:hypothetical protein
MATKKWLQVNISFGVSEQEKLASAEFIAMR